MITDEIKTILYDHELDTYQLKKSSGEKIIVEYDPVDVEHIAYWFNVDYNELDSYWRDYCGGCNDQSSTQKENGRETPF